MKKHRFKCEKLFRDKMPEILTNKGIEVDMRAVEGEEYLDCLKDKLLEETLEVKGAQKREEVTEELADVLEVMYALAAVLNISIVDIEQVRINKKQNKGGFDERLYVNCVEMDQDHVDLNYYKLRPNDYQEVI